MTAADRLADPTTAPALVHRPELDGLRAVAILVVVLYHAEVPGFSGGYVGVDVFFALSGYLITRQLVGGGLGGGATAVVAFWARRVRRLVPAMTAMIALTSALVLALLAPSDALLAAPRAAAAAVYLPNVAFAISDGDYFRGPLQESPFLHTWSLGVEEQLYLVWPLLLLGATAVLRHRRGALVGVIAGVLVVSFATSVALTATGSAWAFYGPQSRAWQLAAGGLVAVTPWAARRARGGGSRPACCSWGWPWCPSTAPPRSPASPPCCPPAEPCW